MLQRGTTVARSVLDRPPPAHPAEIPMRLLALLAVTALGSGCYVSTCDTPSYSVSWRFRGQAAGVSNLRCSDTGPGQLSAAIAYVDVYMNDVRVVSAAPCTDYGATVLDVLDGSYDVRVEGLDASLFVVNRDQFTTRVGSCGQTANAAQPSEGTLELDWVPPGSTCVSGAAIWFRVTDRTATPPAVVYVVDELSSAADRILYACSGPTIQLPVASGHYSLDWIEEVSNPGNSSWAGESWLCSGAASMSQTVPGAGVYTISASLVTSGLACH